MDMLYEYIYFFPFSNVIFSFDVNILLRSDGLDLNKGNMLANCSGQTSKVKQ